MIVRPHGHGRRINRNHVQSTQVPTKNLHLSFVSCKCEGIEDLLPECITSILLLVPYRPNHKKIVSASTLRESQEKEGQRLECL